MASEQELAERRRKWQDLHGQTIDLDEYEDDLVEIIEQIAAAEHLTPGEITRLLYRVSKGDGPVGKDQVVQAYRELAARGIIQHSRETLAKLRTKPVRTISGVAPVTVLTKPSPARRVHLLPRVFLNAQVVHPDEPGALRAGQLQFDPYQQSALRIRALENIGHSTDKIELLILGGRGRTIRRYQEWFIRRCLDAMTKASLRRSKKHSEETRLLRTGTWDW